MNKSGAPFVRPRLVGTSTTPTPRASASASESASTSTSCAASSGAAGSARVMQCMEVFGGNEAVDATLEVPGLDVGVHAAPSGGASGGDVHYVSSCATGRIARILVADVAGHGPHVSTIAEALRKSMRRFVNYVSCDGLMAGLNRACLEIADDARFASAVVATYWAPGDRLVLSNAGHPRPLWYRARRASWSYVDARASGGTTGPANIPFGVVDEVRYDAVALRLRPGDVLVFYTDAILDAVRSDGTRLMEDGLLDVVKKLEPDRLAASPRLLLSAIEEHAAARPTDDVTVVALRHQGARASARHVLKATSDFGRAAIGALRGEGPFPWPEFGVANLLGAFVPALNRFGGGAALDP
jgi:phosphoserine phosphatase RsbU/P